MAQTVKEVLQSLIDDGMVQADKIGSSNCRVRAYMSFPHGDTDVMASLLEFSVSTRCPGQSALGYSPHSY